MTAYCGVDFHARKQTVSYLSFLRRIKTVAKNETKPLKPAILVEDLEIYAALKAMENCRPANPAYSKEAIEVLHTTMLAKGDIADFEPDVGSKGVDLAEMISRMPPDYQVSEEDFGEPVGKEEPRSSRADVEKRPRSF
jgi:hypothetical protein